MAVPALSSRGETEVCERTMSYPIDPDSALTYGLGGPSDTIRLPGFAEASEEVPSDHLVVLGDQIGSGGVGEVFEAVQPSLGRTVAVKILRKATGQSLFGMFENEARITARLNHPNILPVHDLIRIQESPALVMKRVYGESWEDRIRAERESGALALVDHVRVLVSVCRALSYAHNRGVLHLDIKPANVMVGQFGETLLMDWGCAAIHDDERWGPAKGLPRAADIARPMGTPFFMAPEQARGDGSSIGPMTDVFLLGATLYTLLSEEHFRGGTTADEMMDAAREGVMLDVDLDGPPALVRMVRMALQPAPEDRVLTANSMMEGLTDWLDSRESQALVDEAQAVLQRHGEGSSELSDEDRQSMLKALGLFEQAEQNPTVREEATRGRDAVRVRLAEAALQGQTPGLARTMAMPLPSEHPRRSSLLAEAETQTREQIAQRTAQKRVRLLMVLGALLITVASGVSTALYLQAQQALDAERTALARAEALNQFSGDMLTSVDPNVAKGMDTELLEAILRASSDRAIAAFSDQPELLVSMHGRISNGWHHVGKYADALKTHERIFEVIEEGGSERVKAYWHLDHGKWLDRNGRFDEAFDAYQTAAAAYASLSMFLLEGDAQAGMANALERLERPTEAEAAIDRALGLYLSHGGAPRDMIGLRMVRGRLFSRMGNYDASIAEYERIIQLFSEYAPEDLMGLSSAQLNLGLALKYAGRLEEGLSLYKEALASRQAILPPDHPRVLTVMHNLGNLLNAAGVYSEAEHWLRSAWDGRRKALGVEHRWTVSSGILLVRVLGRLDRHDEAAEVLTILEGVALPDTIRWLYHCAWLDVYLGQSKAEQALSSARTVEALEMPFEPGAARVRELSFFVARSEALAMNGLPVDHRHLVDRVLPELIEEDGHANCSSTKTVQSVRRILSYLGRDAEADALLDVFLPKAKAELAEPGVQWRDAKAACIAELEEGA